MYANIQPNNDIIWFKVNYTPFRVRIQTVIKLCCVGGGGGGGDGGRSAKSGC